MEPERVVACQDGGVMDIQIGNKDFFGNIEQQQNDQQNVASSLKQ